MPKNTVDEIVRFSRLTLDVVQPSEVTDALAFAGDMVTFHSPEDKTDRSDRVEPMRKRAEAYFAVAFLYDIIAPFLALTTPGKQILTTIGISIGTDFPTPVDFQSSMQRAANHYRVLGENLLKQIRPVTAVIEAGDSA